MDRISSELSSAYSELEQQILSMNVRLQNIEIEREYAICLQLKIEELRRKILTLRSGSNPEAPPEF
jgi:hypothetical protein